MFEFEKLAVYRKAKSFNAVVLKLMSDNPDLDRTTRDQLRRAAFSIMLNIAEGTSRYTKPSKRNFYVIARGSAFECVAIFDFLKDRQAISEDQYRAYYATCEELSKMLYQMVKTLGGTNVSH
ncbi:MAG: four helix bundle protein [Bacteroidota bacterium]